jgi:BirA family biotin operon repressor/biotin-[acetyl-CoA-carboxylase] ligase
MFPDLSGTRFADVRELGETDSTNRQLLALAGGGAPEGVVLVAEFQSAGRGRLGRSWLAPPGSALLVSVLLRPGLPPDRLHLVTMAAGVAARSAAAAEGVQLKWPNDLLGPDGRKLAGILAEAAGGAVVVGMGLNVVRPSDVPEELAGLAVWLDELRPGVERRALLEAWLVEYDRLLSDLASVPAAYRAVCSTIGQRVRVEQSGGVLEGVAVDVTDDGHLLLDSGQAVAVGDVVHLRPA